MKKIYLILFLVILIFFISGCARGGGGGSLISGGPGGIEIEFLELQPPEEVREGSEISIALEVTNNAQCDTIGEICVRDTLVGFGGVEKECQEFDFNKMEEINKNVKVDSKKFYFRSEPYSNIDRDFLTTNVIATARYNCQFIAGPQLCIKSLIGEEEQLCRSRETISGRDLRASVAPITISKIEKQLFPESGGVRLIAIIRLKKMNDGNVVSTTFDQGTALDTRGEPIKMDVEYGGYGNMECDEIRDGVFYWKEKDTEKVINCEILLPSVEFEENPLNIMFDYNYEVKESKQITIRKKFDFNT